MVAIDEIELVADVLPAVVAIVLHPIIAPPDRRDEPLLLERTDLVNESLRVDVLPRERPARGGALERFFVHDIRDIHASLYKPVDVAIPVPARRRGRTQVRLDPLQIDALRAAETGQARPYIDRRTHKTVRRIDVIARCGWIHECAGGRGPAKVSAVSSRVALFVEFVAVQITSDIVASEPLQSIGVPRKIELEIRGEPLARMLGLIGVAGIVTGNKR